jgi:hypothetical protein
MSQLQLNEDLVNDLHDVLIKHDKLAEDTGVTMQYLAAIMAFMLAHQNMPSDDKHEFLQQLFGFANHVLDDVLQKNEPAAPADDAFGIWKPS